MEVFVDDLVLLEVVAVEVLAEVSEVLLLNVLVVGEPVLEVVVVDVLVEVDERLYAAT